MTGNDEARRTMDCPRLSCAVRAGARCLSVKGRPMKQVHDERWHAWIRARRAARALAKKQRAIVSRYERSEA